MRDLNYKNILSEVKNKGYFIIKNFIEKNDLNSMKNYWINYFKSKKYFQGNKNIHKTGIVLGDKNYLAFSSDKNIKMLRQVEYLWNQPSENLTMQYGVKLNKIRNNLINKDENYGLNFSPDQIAMHIQINYYAYDEGFMYQHIDGTSKTPMINIAANLTNKNYDFEEGGIELTMNDNSKVNLDDLSEPGDIIIFDGNIKHEVKMIKSVKNLGRISLYPLIHKFYHPQEIPHYLKKISHAHYAIKRRLKFKKKEKLANEI